MSSIWTPSGERPIGRPEPEPAPQPERRRAPAGPDDLTEEEMAEQMLLMQQVLETPAAVVVADHVMALFQLAALYLSPEPPQLDDAQIAIDAMAAVIDAVGPRFGPNERALREGLAQLRMAFVQAKAHSAPPPPAP
jgi:hypothetical protein